MSDYKRVRLKGGSYFFTVNLADRRQRLLTDKIGILLEAIRYVKHQRPFNINGWVVLPDHLHCIWTLPPDDCDYSGRWRAIKTKFTKYCRIESRNKNLVIWQPRCWEHTIRNEADFCKHLDYIHINPLKHGYVTRVRDWQFSSFHYHVSHGRYSINWGNDQKSLCALDIGE